MAIEGLWREGWYEARGEQAMSGLTAEPHLAELRYLVVIKN